MVTYQLLFGALGLLCGIGVAAGVFALVGKSWHGATYGGKNQCGGLCACTGKRTDCRRNLWLCAGCFPGTSISGWNMVPGGVWTGSGVFSGCLSVALAEVLNVFPVLFRRMGIKTGLEILITFFAFGKVAGGLVYFFCVAR